MADKSNLIQKIVKDILNGLMNGGLDFHEDDGWVEVYAIQFFDGLKEINIEADYSYSSVYQEFYDAIETYCNSEMNPVNIESLKEMLDLI